MCDSLCVLGDGSTIFAKSSDRPMGEAQVVESFARRPAGGTLRTQYLTLLHHGAAAFVAGRPTWLWGVEHGVNEHRVAIGNERVWTVDDPDAAEPALLGMDLVRLGLELATDAESAVDRITDLVGMHGQGGVAEAATGEAYFSSFLVSDPTEAWIVETSGRTWAARPVDPRRERGASISNRLQLGTEWTRASRDVPPGANFQRWRDQDQPTAHADQRAAVTTALATREPPPGPRDVVAVLRHHGAVAWGAPGAPNPPDAIDPIPAPPVHRDGTGVSLCMHLRNWEATTGSMVALLPADLDQPMRAWMALANPCVSLFVPVFPPDLVPADLADPRLWARFDALRAWADEAPGGAVEPERLAAIRAVFDPIERDLWDDADAVADDVIRGGDRGPAARFVEAVGPRLRAALEHAERVAEH